MGHMRLGRLPDTAPWRRVVGTIVEGAAIPVVAKATTEAAQDGLDLAKGDKGLTDCFWQLLLTVRAAGGEHEDDMEGQEVHVPSKADVLGVATAFSESLEHRPPDAPPRGPLAEMGGLAGCEALTELLQRRSAGLFGTTPEDVCSAARSLAAPAGFGTLAHAFFSRFLFRFLGHHLGRELHNHVGGCGRFADPIAHTAFLAELGTHCRESATVVRTFAQDWLGKAMRDGEVTRDRASGFVAHALTKLRDEVRLRGQRCLSEAPGGKGEGDGQ